MDRNTVIGFVLLAVLFFGYFYYTSQGRGDLEQQKQLREDSIKRVKARSDSLARLKDTTSTITKPNITSGTFLQDSTGGEKLLTLENDVIKVTFTSKGGQPKQVELKKFKTWDKKPVILGASAFNRISYLVNAGPNQTANTNDLSFIAAAPSITADSSQTLSFNLAGAEGQISHQYVLHPHEYMVDMNLTITGADKLVTQNVINLTWQSEAVQAEKDLTHERTQSHIAFAKSEDYDFEVVGSGNDKKLSKDVNWIAVKQQFFTTALVAKNKFMSADLVWTVPQDTNNHIITQSTAVCRINITGNSTTIPLQLFYGPCDYKILKSYGNEMHNIVDLGSGMFAFVKYINRGFIMPVFNFLGNNLASFGLVIALLTILIRLLIAPLTYQSYLSGAKMKLLKPEIDKLKAKFGDDKQAFGMEQMKLFRSAGVNPLGGCIPALLQIPIFFALYSFFNSNISLRGQNFWWAADLSAYDSIYNLPFNIPFYGSHISLFTITAVVTSLLISLYGMANMQDTGNPVMKYLPFIFPVILMGVFNSQPAALTWYYTVSNVITLLIQYVIQTYIIDHDKVLAKLEANKKKPVTKSKWQMKVEAMQENNKKLQEMQQKNKGNKQR